MVSKSKAITVAITTVALSLGSVGIATASNSKNSSKAKISISSTVVKPMHGFFGAPGIEDKNGDLAAVLAALVVKGTVTQAQVDAIKVALTAAQMAKMSQGDKDRLALEALIVTTIGIDAATIRTRLAAGESLAAIAGVKKDALIAVLVVEATKRIDAAVLAGKLTAVQATSLKATLVVQITAQLSAVGSKGHGMHDDGDNDHEKRGGHDHDGKKGKSSVVLKLTAKG